MEEAVAARRAGVPRRVSAVVIFILAAVLVAPCSLYASESFRYDLRWMGIKAGEARLDFLEDGDSLRIVSRAESAKWLSVFYKVDDRVESVVVRKDDPGGEADGWAAVRYRLKIREGRYRRDKELIFDRESATVLFVNHLEKKKKVYPVPEDTFDPLSGFFLLRKRPLEVGRPVHVTIFDSNRVWKVRVDILRREEVKTRAGRFRTVVVKPDMKSEGIFDRKGDIYIYLTDDERHIPVLIRTKVAVGYIEAELVGGDY
ncbi:MAG: DUF3108 domain-containing protein [Nitrospirae bacterium]|nr:DUF3108 domain-containing protein [Nitrospirota bacterium]